jgi:hypothetical protein
LFYFWKEASSTLIFSSGAGVNAVADNVRADYNGLLGLNVWNTNYTQVLNSVTQYNGWRWYASDKTNVTTDTVVPL